MGCLCSRPRLHLLVWSAFLKNELFFSLFLTKPCAADYQALQTFHGMKTRHSRSSQIEDRMLIWLSRQMPVPSCDQLVAFYERLGRCFISSSDVLMHKHVRMTLPSNNITDEQSFRSVIAQKKERVCPWETAEGWGAGRSVDLSHHLRDVYSHSWMTEKLSGTHPGRSASLLFFFSSPDAPLPILSCRNAEKPGWLSVDHPLLLFFFCHYCERRGQQRNLSIQPPSPTFPSVPLSLCIFSFLLSFWPSSRKSNQAGSVLADCWGWEVSCCGWHR